MSRHYTLRACPLHHNVHQSTTLGTIGTLDTIGLDTEDTADMQMLYDHNGTAQLSGHTMLPADLALCAHSMSRITTHLPTSGSHTTIQGR